MSKLPDFSMRGKKINLVSYNPNMQSMDLKQILYRYEEDRNVDLRMDLNSLNVRYIGIYLLAGKR